MATLTDNIVGVVTLVVEFRSVNRGQSIAAAIELTSIVRRRGIGDKPVRRASAALSPQHRARSELGARARQALAMMAAERGRKM